jgi:hypothetical protein
MTAGGAYTLKHATIQQLSIPTVSLAAQLPIISLVEQVLLAKKTNTAVDTAALEKEIDRLIYGLYGLTEEEIGIIESV